MEEEARLGFSRERILQIAAPQTDGNLVYYAADNSRLCVRRIVLAQVECRSSTNKSQDGVENAPTGRIFFPWFLLGILQPHLSRGRG